MTPPPNLCYTVALDKPGEDVHRQMARLLVTSLLKTNWDGPIVVIRNHPAPVYPEGHPQVREIVPEKVDPHDRPMKWKYRARDYLDLQGIGKVLFLDCDCIALRDINHLLMGSWDLYIAAEPFRLTEAQFNGYLTDAEMASLREQYGLNSGTLGISAGHFVEAMKEWERIERTAQLRSHSKFFLDQHSWNRLVLDSQLRRRSFAPGEVQFPFLNGATYLDYRKASLIHVANQGPRTKLALLFGLWMERFAMGRLEELTSAGSRLA